MLRVTRLEKGREDAPKKCRGPRSPNTLQRGSIVDEVELSRPNGFLNGPGPSNWISGGANFAKGLRPLALNPFSGLAAGARSGGFTPHCARVLAIQASSKNPLHAGARYMKGRVEEGRAHGKEK